MTVKTSDKHQAIRTLLKWVSKDLKIPTHEEKPWKKVDSRFKGVWLQPEGVHFVRGVVAPGHLAHEIGHWAMMRPTDRARLKPGCLSDQGIDTCISDIGAETWGAKAFIRLQIPIEIYVDNIEDYPLACGDIYSEEHWRLWAGVQILKGDLPGHKLLSSLGMFQDAPGSWFPSDRVWVVHDRIKQDMESQGLSLEKILGKPS